MEPIFNESISDYQLLVVIWHILHIALNLYNLNLPRGNDIAMHYCCVPCKYPGYRSHYPKRCLHLTMNECQRKFPQMWHSRRLPFHNKDNCPSHSNRWLYSFQGSGERQNIAKSRLVNYSTFKIHMLLSLDSHLNEMCHYMYRFFIQLTS